MIGLNARINQNTDGLKQKKHNYRQVSNISRTKHEHLKVSRTVCLVAVFAESLEARC